MEKKIEFNGSQEKLFATIENLYRQEKITGYQWGNGEADSLGYIWLQIKKARVLRQNDLPALNLPEHALGGITFENIGHIKIGIINSDESTLEPVTDNAELMQFVDELAPVIAEYIPLHVDVAQVGAVIQEPPKPKGKYDDLCVNWVTRLEIPHQKVEEFLSEQAPELTRRTFYRVVLPDAYKRELINKKGRTYIPKE
jgi:hypothetical protein